MRKVVAAVLIAACIFGYLAWRYSVMAEHLVAQNCQVEEFNP